MLSPWHPDLSKNQITFILLFTVIYSSLQAVDNPTVHNKLFYKVLKDYSDLIKTGRHIIFCWVPGHVGITGNEVVDKAAKVGLNQAVTTVQFPATDLLCSIKKLCTEKWQESWNTCINNKLQETTLVLYWVLAVTVMCYLPMTQ